jgi:pyruvate/2-oxoglutarate dehydrogenase complex dihydrolipoamide dehydrogenase (E3) component
MSDSSYDFVVIGGGSAGYAAACTAARVGRRVLVIEGGDEVGGLCILRGCMPSKTLLESSHRARVMREASEFGLLGEYHGADLRAIRHRKRQLIGEFADYRREQLESGKFEFLRGHARFTGSHSVEVTLLDGNTREITSATFLIATGSRIQHVEVPGLEDVGYLTSDDVLDADTRLKSVTVLGGGAIALELATFYAGLGVKTTVIQRNAQVLKEVDADVAAELTAGLEHNGITVHAKTALVRAEKSGDGKTIYFYQDGKERSVTSDEIIFALGRTPNTTGLGLEAAGVELKHSAIRTNAAQQTSQPHIFAAGDVCGPYEVVHIAIQQGEAAACNADCFQAGKPAESFEKVDYRLKLFAVFTDPQVAAVGLTEREAADAGIPFIEAKYPFKDHGKSIIMSAKHGFVKLLAHQETREILGGAVVGPQASELIHEIVVAIRFRATAGQLATTPHYHPTLSEIWTYPAEALAEVAIV